MATYYLSTTGNDANPGTIGSPWLTFDELENQGLVAGDTVYIRGGTYQVSKAASVEYRFRIDNIDGSSGNPIRIENYPSEAPVLDLSNILCTGAGPTGLYVGNCSWLVIKGIRITGLAQDPTGGPPVCAMNVTNTPNSTFENIEVDHCGGYGFYNTNSNNNLFLNCDAHHLDDRYTTGDEWHNANGFNITGGDASTNVTFRYCRAWWISDDGWDFYNTDGTFTLDGCWAFWNGYEPGTFTPVPSPEGMGFKLGPCTTNQSANLRRIIKNCVAFENYAYGFDQNSAQCRFELYNNTTFDNGLTGFNFIYHQSITQQSKNNLSYLDPLAYDGGNVAGTFNSWNGGVTVSGADFLSTSSSGMDGARQADGSLPVVNFMKLASGSDLIDAGTDVGIAFNGAAPDMGAFEFDVTTTTTTSTSSTTTSSTTTTTTAAPTPSYFTKSIIRMGIIANSKSVPTTTSTTTTSTSTTTTTTAAPTYPDLTTVTSDSLSKNVSAQTATPTMFQIKDDGTKLYVTGYSGVIYQYTLSTPYNISTATYDSVSLDVSTSWGQLFGLFIKSDGTKLYLQEQEFGAVRQYTMSTPWDLSTATYDTISLSVAAQDATGAGITFNASGTKLYFVGYSTGNIYQYTLGTSWDLSTASYASILKDYTAQQAVSGAGDIQFSSDGVAMYISGISNDELYQYALGTPENVSTATYASKSFDTTPIDTTPYSFNILNGKIYILMIESIHQYSISST